MMQFYVVVFFNVHYIAIARTSIVISSTCFNLEFENYFATFVKFIMRV